MKFFISHSNLERFIFIHQSNNIYFITRGKIKPQTLSSFILRNCNQKENFLFYLYVFPHYKYNNFSFSMSKISVSVSFRRVSQPNQFAAIKDSPAKSKCCMITCLLYNSVSSEDLDMTSQG